MDSREYTQDLCLFFRRSSFPVLIPAGMAMPGPGTQWVRQPPDDTITAPAFFPFYPPDMTFETFVRSFSDRFSYNRPAAVMTGIRADEFYNCFWLSRRRVSGVRSGEINGLLELFADRRYSEAWTVK